jgi:lysophospholipase L1-like esterase
VATIVLATLVACGPTVPPQPGNPAEPEHCPYEPSSVQSNGDSVGFGYAARLRLPAPYTLFNAAQGASSWTITTQVPSIASRVRESIERCGVPGALIIEGGVIDVTRSMPMEDVFAVVSELSAWLAEREVPTVWVPVNPFPSVSPYYVGKESRRLAYNAWLATEGNVTGDVVDCEAALEDPARPGTLNPAFWSIVDLQGNPDGIHPNADGYRAMADCVRPVVLDVLTREPVPEPPA